MLLLALIVGLSDFFKVHCGHAKERRHSVQLLMVEPAPVSQFRSRTAGAS